MSLRLLVVDGNVQAAREAHRTSYGKTPSQSYADTLRAIAPDAVCDICFPADRGANLPNAQGLEEYDGVAVTGSALNIYDGGEAIERQLELARAVYASKTAFFGSCWGLQLATAASGGSVVKNPLGREVGIARNIAVTEAGSKHPLLAGRPGAFDAPCTHLDVVAVPPGDATILAHNRFAIVQAAEIRHAGGVFWGVQYHPEFSLTELGTIIERRAASLAQEGMFANEAQGKAYCAELRDLDRDPRRSDIAWRLGIQPELIDAELRLTELRNWISLRVRPEKSRRGRA
ncbi:GMP synthase (glutamine-hydrolysing) [Rhizobiales bacterium GAS188]|nr:GMP synthase (glutamine-hydrolysing) [Rhizobiales bacterium GAS188]